MLSLSVKARKSHGTITTQVNVHLPEIQYNYIICTVAVWKCTYSSSEKQLFKLREDAGKMQARIMELTRLKQIFCPL